MSDDRPKLYLDANAIIHFLESRWSEVTALFERAAERQVELYTSELTLAEILVLPMREEDHEMTFSYLDFLRSDSSMTVVTVDRDVLIRSAALRAQLGGKLPDAIHVASAQLAGCEAVVSSDRRLRLPDGLVRIPVEYADRWNISR